MPNMDKLELTAPEDIPNTFIEAWNEKNAEKLASIFDEDAEFINVTGLWWHDRESIFQAHDYGLKVIFKDSTLTFRKSKVKYLSDTMVLQSKRMLELLYRFSLVQASAWTKYYYTNTIARTVKFTLI